MGKYSDILEKVNAQCSIQSVHFKYTKHLNVSEKYKKGRLATLKWMDELSYMLMLREKHIKKELIKYIQKEKQKTNLLVDGDYKNGILDQLNWLELTLKNL
jgi:hypothetical protein